jgi:hypothetical protein
MPTTNNPNQPISGGGAAPAAAPGPCRTVRAPEGQLNCDFCVDPGPVKLKIVSKKGTVRFEDVLLNQQRLPGLPSDKISFDVPSRSVLDVTYFFSDTDNGAGELREDCDGNTFLKNVSVTDQAVEYIICTPKSICGPQS